MKTLLSFGFRWMEEMNSEIGASLLKVTRNSETLVRNHIKLSDSPKSSL